MSSDVEIHGHCDTKYQIVKEAFTENFRQGLEVGASLAVTEGGKYVVDLWGGYADRAALKPWEEDTLVLVYSTSKIPTALCALMLVDRGELDLDAPVAQYWPEFAQGGKEKLPVRYLFSHSAGLPGFDEKIPFEALYDWEGIVARLASQEPWWEPGTVSGYHGVTMGFLLGELVRRITGQSLGTFFRTEVAEKLGSDFHIGLPEKCRPRVAEILQEVFRTYEPKPGSIAARWLENQPSPSDPQWSSNACQSAEIPSVNGHGNARSIARLGSAIAMGGELDGVHLLSRATLDKALEEQIYVTDLCIGAPIRFGLGMALSSPEFPMPNPNTLHWGGYGGSFCTMDLDAGICCAYAMNHLLPDFGADPRNESIQKALFSVMESR